MEQIDLHTYLAIAAEVLDVDSDTITRITNIPLAESALHAPFASFGEEEFYADPVEKAGVLCSRLIRTYGSLLVAGGIDLPSVKAAMGHSHITTTERYLHARPAGEMAERFTRALGGTPIPAVA
jgi:hypothetical protein